jgi:hypothetical protein
MKKFEYQVDQHPSDEFSQLIMFCSEKGECSLQQVPGQHIDKLTAMLNDKGKAGWELVQLVFGEKGLLVIWKKAIDGRISNT